ncbi:alkyl hydroperoxide reductase subunit AhpF [Pseudomonas corrugata]|uniref:hypothetical protein n=1 Tax=Pseudomonas corrugata TaxID=47879 RepID=UPI0028598FB2|nr:hypothetical protein [Pseudomonas corrugata]MDR7285700.1 alkyl hydroperoxide reductase subunit AhpF [Pseudomonas corrugata]
MSSNYISDGEREYLEKRKAEAAAMELFFEAKNNELVGDIKTYKGINYRMHQRGHYQCLDLPPLSGLDGSFTSTFMLHKIIDDMERMKKLPKSGK